VSALLESFKEVVDVDIPDPEFFLNGSNAFTYEDLVKRVQANVTSFNLTEFAAENEDMPFVVFLTKLETKISGNNLTEILDQSNLEAMETLREVVPVFAEQLSANFTSKLEDAVDEFEEEFNKLLNQMNE